MKMKRLLIFALLFTTLNAWGMTLNEIVELSTNSSDIYRARNEIVRMALSNPSSPEIYKVANLIYSKIKILQSADSTPLRELANAVLKENKSAFYSLLASNKIKTLPSAFSLVFNVIDVRQDYTNFFSHIFDSDFAGAVNDFRELKCTYKIPNLSKYLPTEDTMLLWSFLVQGIQLYPDVFDANGAKFLADILTPYQVRTLYMKTYVWLSGLSVQQAQQGLNVVEFENMISSFSSEKMDPNLLQWKYTTSKYLSLYTSITNLTRQLSVAKNLRVYLNYAPTFFKAIEEFPAQYRQPLSKQLSTYLDLLNQRLADSKVLVSRSVLKEIRNLAVKYSRDPNSAKLMALTLGQNVGTSLQRQEKKKETNSIDNFEAQSPDVRLLIPFLAVLFVFLIPRVRLSFYRLLKLNGLEMRYYFRRLSSSPADFRWHLKLANFYERLGKFDEAQREYSLAMKLMKTGGNGYENRK